MNKAYCIAVIPARYQSTRFPGKPLAHILGKPMIQWVYENAAAASAIDEVSVATDDQRIADAVEAFGGKVVLTHADHPSGSDRVAEAVQDQDPDLVLNIQGDEPLISPEALNQLAQTLPPDGITPEMATLAVPLSRGQEETENPNNVKVVVDGNNNGLYFSRAPIPYKCSDGTDAGCLWHWGIYAYRGWYLRRFVSLRKGQLESCEKLEQLRALEDGARIRVLKVDAEPLDVNVPEDIARVEQVLSEKGDAQ